MVEQSMILPYYGIQCSTKKEQTIDTHNNLGGSQGHCLICLYNILEITKIIEMEKSSGCQVLGTVGRRAMGVAGGRSLVMT